MNARERLFAALKGEPVDRIPAWLLFPYHYYGSYTDVRNNPCYRTIHELALKKAITLNRRSIGAPRWTPDVKTEQSEFIADGCKVKRTTHSYAGRSICSETRHCEAGTRKKPLLASDEDLETYLSFPVETDRTRIYTALEKAMPKYLKEKEEFPEEYGAMMLCIGEPIVDLYHTSQREEYAIWSLTHSEAIEAHLAEVLEAFKIKYEFFLERDAADVYFLVGSELAAPPLVSVDTFSKWIVPQARALIDLVHSYGKLAIQHFHGHIKAVLPYFAEMAPDGLHTIEAPPVGNCTHVEAFNITGNKITLIGNIQYDCFRSYSQEQMREAVIELIREADGRRLILSPTAGPYEENISENMIRNYITFIETVWSEGKL
jgi:hypothetical protein